MRYIGYFEMNRKFWQKAVGRGWHPEKKKDAKVILVVGCITLAIWVTWVVTRWLPYGVGTLH